MYPGPLQNQCLIEHIIALLRIDIGFEGPHLGDDVCFLLVIIECVILEHVYIKTLTLLQLNQA